MSEELTKEKVIQHKKAAIKKLNALLEMYINDDSNTHLKKANLISYWLESYSTYLRNEETFDPKRLISYKRGYIIKADFGFNVGSEPGGLHYAVVLDSNNRKNSPVVTVVPLSSGTETSVYERDVFLGNELYTKALAKHKVLLESANEKLANFDKLLKALSLSSADSAYSIISDLQKQYDETKADVTQLQKYKREIEHMNQGSIAMMEQITTISKMRIYVPRKSRDIFYGISFSASAMEKINSQIHALLLK